MDRLFILIFWWMCLFADCCQRSRYHCLYSQIDCDPYPGSTAPGPNKYAEYITKICKPPGQSPVCTYRTRQEPRPIDNLNNPNLLLLQSPNTGPGQNYRNRRLVSYNVQCPTGRLPFLVFDKMDIQPRECFGFCEDYIRITPNCIDFGDNVNGCGSSKSCGTRPKIDNFNLNSEHFTVTFRTSPFDGYPGFQLSVTCFEPEPLDDGRGSEVRDKRSARLPINITLTPLEQQIMKNLTAEFFELIPRCVTSDVNATSRPVKTSALHLSLAFENSSNPVIRTAVATTLSITERQDSARVDGERIRIRYKCGRNNGGCEQNCTETDISVQCSCITGYALDTDERSCYEINECLVNNGGCEQICTNTPGSRQCSCRPGFVLAANGMTCTVGLSVSITVDYARPADFFPDVNEYRSASGPVNVTCIATGPGTGAVSYQWSSTCRNCPFRTATSSIIRQAAVHSGDNGTHTCVATKDGNTARTSIDFLIVEINECLVNNGGCAQMCTNIQGSYQCRCRSGYRAIRTRCIDVDECSSNNGGCAQICTNIQGSHRCSCRSGYRASGTRCIDINECSANNGGCTQICTNFQGSRRCSCRSGYRAIGTQCIDIDECSSNNGSCAQICTNIQGSHRCSCRSGYRASGTRCIEFLSYIQLGNTPGVTRNSVIGDDACSREITIPVNFHFGDLEHTTAYVCTNGLITFGTPRTVFTPTLFTRTSPIHPVVAPFWADINVNDGGNIWYEVHTDTTSPALLTQVNDFIQTLHQNSFTGTWMLVAEWNNVPRFRSPSPLQLNTFQGLIITNGFQSYTVFTYHCGDINWGGGATIGFKGDNDFFRNHTNSGGLADSIDCQSSTTGNNIVYHLNT